MLNSYNVIYNNLLITVHKTPVSIGCLNSRRQGRGIMSAEHLPEESRWCLFNFFRL